MKKKIPYLCFVIAVLYTGTFFSQNQKGFVVPKDIFGNRVFIENKGQFNKDLPNEEKVLFVYENLGEKICFTEKGLVYVQTEKTKMNEEEQEERGKTGHLKNENLKTYFVYMNWPGSNTNQIQIISEEKQNHYFSYGKEELKSSTFKKLIYKNVYKNLDVEFTLPEDKEYGIEYSLIARAGADLSEFKIEYKGDIKKMKLKEGNVIISTSLNNLTEHAPYSYYEDKSPVAIEFKLTQNTLSFNFPNGYRPAETIIVDPWVTAISTLSTNNCGYDIDYDNNGNVIVYGGTYPNFKIAKYNSSGILQWSFNGILASPSWTTGQYSGGILVHRPTGKIYVCRWNLNTISSNVVRLDVNANYDNFISAGPLQQYESTDMDFTCTGDIMVFGGAWTPHELINVNTQSITIIGGSQSSGTICCQDIACYTKDDFGNFFEIYGSGPSNLGNSISALAPSYTTNLWTVPSTYTPFTEINNRNALMGGGAINYGTGFKCLAVNANFLYYYDGLHITAYNKTNGSLVASTSSGLNLKGQSGIAVDDCDNLYVGGNAAILSYHFNGTAFSTLTSIPINANITNQYVYDIILDKPSKTLYVTGSGFVGTYSATNSMSCAIATSCSCVQPYLTINTATTGCANIASATVNVGGGMVGPFTYSWNPGGQTNSVVTGLSPGTYTVSAYSASCNVTATGLCIFTSTAPPCISVNSTSITCSSLGSATITPTYSNALFSYTWMPSNQTGSVATGLSPGTYTITVLNQQNNTTFTTTTTFISLIPLTGQLSSSFSLTCNGASTGTAGYTNINGGSAIQNYVWTNGTTTYSSTSPYTTSLSAGLWSSTVTDALTGCQINNAFIIFQPPAITLALLASSPSVCAGGSVTINSSASGGSPINGNNYNYILQQPNNIPINQPNALSATYTVSSATATALTYTLLSKDQYSCTAVQTITVNYIPNPTIQVTSANICPLEVATITAIGANNYTITNISSNISTQFNNTPSMNFTDSPNVTTNYSIIGSSQSCTSTALGVIILKSTPVPNMITNSPRCEGQNLTFSGSGGASYQFTGPQNFNSAIQSNTLFFVNPSNSGVYNLTVTALNNCTASSNLTLVVNPSPTISVLGSTVCTDQTLALSAQTFTGSTFQWTGPNGFISSVQNPTLNGPSVNASGNYSVKVTSAQGCTNSAITQVTVTQKPTTIPGSDSPRCLGETLNLNGTNTQGANVFSWIGPNGFSSTQQNPTLSAVSLSSNGTYSLTVSFGPCVATNTTNVLVNALPSATATNNGPICETKKFILDVNSSTSILMSFIWQGPLQFISYVKAAPRDSSVLNHSGLYTVTVTDNFGCKSSVTTSVTVMNNPTVTSSNATVCLNDPAFLTANGASTYSWWDLNGNFSNTQKATVSKSGNPNPTTYTVVGQSVNSCTAIAVSTLVTLPLPDPEIILSKSRICINEDLTMNAVSKKAGTPLVGFLWYGPNNFNSSGQQIRINIFTQAQGGTYSLIVSDVNNCVGEASQTVTVLSLPTGYFSSSKTEGCAPFSTDIFFKLTNNLVKINVSDWIVFKDGVKQDPSFYLPNTKTFQSNKAGNFILSTIISDSSNCINTINQAITVHSKPKIDFVFTPNVPVEKMDEVLFEAVDIISDNNSDSKILNWNWEIGIQNSNNIAQHSNKMYRIFYESGNLPIVLTGETAFGCKDTLVKSIHVDEDFTVFVPSAFSPNADGKNETFFPVMRAVKEMRFEIFNRWGERLFETTSQNSGWDGTFNGKDCKQDVYVWKLRLTGKSLRGEKNLTGEVTLIR